MPTDKPPKPDMPEGAFMGPRQKILATGLLALALGPLAAHAAIFRCAAAGGAVSYQATPCPDPEVASTLDVPSEYPAVDTQQRDRLLQREAALDQRLEARRERESRETIASIGRHALVQAARAQAEAAAPAYIMGWPQSRAMRPWQRAHRPPRNT
jgi:hypothetical protein